MPGFMSSSWLYFLGPFVVDFHRRPAWCEEVKPTKLSSVYGVIWTSSAMFEDMRRDPPVPTLEQLRRGTPWTWVVLRALPVSQACRIHSSDYSLGSGRLQRHPASLGTLRCDAKGGAL